jgi:hypothetical protein
MSKPRIHYANFSQSLEIGTRAGAPAIVYAFGESAPRSRNLLSEGVARQTQTLGESFPIFNLLAAAKLIIGYNQFPLFRVEIIQTFLQTIVSDLRFDSLAGVDYQIVRRGLSGWRRIIV